MTVEIKGADQLAALSKRLKELGDKDLSREFSRAITAATKPLVQDLRQSARETLPKRGGLNERVAKSQIRTQRRASSRTQGVRVVAKNPYVLARLDQGMSAIRVFGRPSGSTRRSSRAGGRALLRRSVLRSAQERRGCDDCHAAEAGRATVTSLGFDLYWKDHGAQKGLQNLGKQAEQTHGSFGKFTATAGKFTSVAGKGFLTVGKAAVSAGALGAVALAGIGAAGIGMGLKVASGNEQAKISFTTMLGSAQKANAFLRDLQKFAAETPFEFPELQTAASSLISIGVKAKDVIPIMTTLGNTTAGMGTGSEGIKRATVAIQQMNAAQSIHAQDLNQLRDAGIPVYDLLAASLHKSKKEIAEMVQSGDLARMGRQPVDALMEGLKTGKGLERFSGLMEKQSHSLAGMVSTLKDTVGMGLAKAVTPAFPLIKQGLEGVSGASSKFFGFLGKNRGSIATIFKSAGETLKTMGAIGSAVFGSFAKSAAGGKNAFKTFADFLATHQEDITNGLLTGAKAALGLGKSLATGAATGLRVLGTLADASTGMTTIMLAGFSAILHGMAETWGFIPGIGPKLKAADKSFATFSQHAVAGMRKIGPGARAAADMIDKNVVPAIDKAQGSLDKIGKTEIAKAKLRDSAARAALAIKNIGTTSDGAQIKLKKFNDVSKLGATQQTALKGRLSDARNALRAQIRTMQDAHVGQDKLTAAWQKGKDRLYAEFRQMGLSRAEARRLAAQYAGIKPKVKTTISQPGMSKSRGDAKDYHGKLADLARYKKINTTANLTFKNNAGKIVANLNKSFQLVKGGPRLSFAAGGVFPGYTPRRDVHKFYSPTGGVIEASGGERSWSRSSPSRWVARRRSLG
jgi:tape measure domain-containing protein